MTMKYIPDRTGSGEMLRSREMQDAMLRIADLIKDEAVARAPVGTETGKGKDPGRYKQSFHTMVVARGGATGDRAEASCYNDAEEASFVEFGKHGVEPYHTLLRAASEVRL